MEKENRRPWKNSRAVIIPVIAGVAIAIVIGTSINVSAPRSSYAKDFHNPPQSVTIIIPEGASIPDSSVSYLPNNVTVVLGTNNTVTWLNNDLAPECINSNFEGLSRACEDESLILPGKTWSYTFTEEGVYQYYSLPHPWLHGTLIVKGEGLSQPLRPENKPVYPEVTVVRANLSNPNPDEGGQALGSYTGEGPSLENRMNQVDLFWSRSTSVDGKDVVIATITNTGSHAFHLESFGIAAYTASGEMQPVFFSYAVNSNYFSSNIAARDSPIPPITEDLFIEPGQTWSAIFIGKLEIVPSHIPVTQVEIFATYHYDEDAPDYNSGAQWWVRTVRPGEPL